MLRIAIDTGGTFTDFVFQDLASGARTFWKTLSTPAEPERAVREGLAHLFGPLGAAPVIDYPQLIESARLNPTIWSGDGILLGWLLYGDQKIWILSDPDILSNHGLARGDNAVLTMRLIDAMRPPDSASAVDTILATSTGLR